MRLQANKKTSVKSTLIGSILWKTILVQENFFGGQKGHPLESRPVEVSPGNWWKLGCVRQECSAVQDSTSLSSRLCRPAKLFGPNQQKLWVLWLLFLKLVLLFICASIPLPLSPCFPGLICHCGLIISACSCTSFQPANLPLWVCVTVAARSCSGASTWSPPPLEPLKFAKAKP